MKLRFLAKLPKDKLQKVVLTAIVTIGAAVGVLELYVLPNWRALIDAKTRIATLKAQIQQAEDTARQATKEEAYRNEVKSFVETQQTLMVAGDPFAWVVREFSLLAEKHPIRVEGLHAGSKLDASSSAKCQPYGTRIDIRGTFDEIGTFVQDLENKFPVCEIRNLSISGNADEKGYQQAAIELILRIRPEQTTASAEAKKS